MAKSITTPHSRSFDKRVAGIVHELLRDPLGLPAEFRGYIARRAEVDGLILPSSSITGLRSVEDTVAELGPKIHGQPALLRVGPTPFEFVALVYDSTYGKWVSQPMRAWAQAGVVTTTSTGYTGFGSTGTYPVVPHYKTAYDAGLRLQVFLSVTMRNNTAGQTTFIISDLYDIADGQAAATLLDTVGELQVTSMTSVYKMSVWGQFGGTAPSNAHGLIGVQVKVSGGTGTYEQISQLYRWVSA
jgi:hypothetical protein